MESDQDAHIEEGDGNYYCYVVASSCSNDHGDEQWKAVASQFVHDFICLQAGEKLQSSKYLAAGI